MRGTPRGPAPPAPDSLPASSAPGNTEGSPPSFPAGLAQRRPLLPSLRAGPEQRFPPRAGSGGLRRDPRRDTREARP